MSRKQCDHCPWRKGSDPFKIPGGYSPEKHAALVATIADPGSMRGTGGRTMACHETATGAEKACVGWLAHQLGPGNNIALRTQAAFGKLDVDFETVGPQHERFEDTLPKGRRALRARRFGGAL